jgi:ribonuclease HI
MPRATAMDRIKHQHRPPTNIEKTRNAKPVSSQVTILRDHPPPSRNRNKNTDGSLNPSTKTTTCAVVVPSLSIEEAYTLEEKSSIFPAEGHGIVKAKEIILQHNDPISEIIIFSDSKSITQAINSPSKEKHQIINLIMQAAEGLRSTGTKATVYWIPSHVGIDGNEKADILAATESSSNEPIYKIYNKLSVNEQCIKLKIHLQTKFLEELNKENNKPNLKLNKIGLLKWHNHNSRELSRILSRLRTGHNRLNGQQARFNPNIDPIYARTATKEKKKQQNMPCSDSPPRNLR